MKERAGDWRRRAQQSRAKHTKGKGKEGQARNDPSTLHQKHLSESLSPLEVHAPPLVHVHVHNHVNVYAHPRR